MKNYSNKMPHDKDCMVSHMKFLFSYIKLKNKTYKILIYKKLVHIY